MANQNESIFTNLPYVSPQLTPAVQEQAGGASINDLKELVIGSGNKSLHANQEGFWMGAERFADAPLSFDMLGNGILKSITAEDYIQAGGAAADINTHTTTVSGGKLTDDTVTSAKAKLAMKGWTMTNALTAIAADKVGWGAGEIRTSDGTVYSIAAGDTGVMAARTFIYLDLGVSQTALQVTTTAANAIGDGKLLVATAINGTGEAQFEVFSGVGGMNIPGTSIVAGSITGNEVAANTITANKLSVASLSAIAADLGTITAGNITLNTSGFIRGGQTDFNTGNGFYLGYSVGAYKFSVGNSATGQSLTYDGVVMRLNGVSLSNEHIFGSGIDGAFDLDGVNTYAGFFSKVGNVYTQLVDLYFTTLIVRNGCTWITNGFRWFGKTKLTIEAGGKACWDGNNGVSGQNGTSSYTVDALGGAGGAALTSQSLAGSVAGKDGGYGAHIPGSGGYGGAGIAGGAGVAGSSVSNSFQSSFTGTSGNGGNGGSAFADGIGSPAAGGGAGAAGAGGTLTSASKIRPYCVQFAVEMLDKFPGAALAYLTYNAGYGGGGGGGSGTSAYKTGYGQSPGGGGGAGGGSGSGGGTMVGCCREIVNNGTISCVGGNGGNGGNGVNGQNGGPSAPYGGGGGAGGGGGRGGPGGVIVLVYASLSGSGTISVAAGVCGTGGTGGLKGTAYTGYTPTYDGVAGANGVTPAAATAGKIITFEI
ncbi:MAG: hypothetical protein PHC53_02680 [Patescibacteria group bacterium]|nr:hypothetical protein [Patescibacteria group bacterium]